LLWDGMMRAIVCCEIDYCTIYLHTCRLEMNSSNFEQLGL
jgi:hypothetical protein